MSGTRKRLYFARRMPAADMMDVLRCRFEYNARLRELGYVIVDPYAPLLDRCMNKSSLTLQPGEAEGTVLAATEQAAASDLFFALVYRNFTSRGAPFLDEVSVLALASPEELEAIHRLDKERIYESDVFIANLAKTSREQSSEVEIAHSRGMLRFGFGDREVGEYEDQLNATYSTFGELLSVLEAHNSGEGPYLTTAPVNKVQGEVLIYGIDMASLYPHLLTQVIDELSYPRRLFSFCCERSHVHELAQKLPVMLRLGGVTKLTVLTKDGSPHDVQMHTMVQEVVENVGYMGPVVHRVVEHGTLHAVSSAAVKASRHLHMTERLIGENDGREAPARGSSQASRKPCVGIIVGGKSDLKSVEGAGLRDLLDREGIAHTFEVISSDREPERLRLYCLANAKLWDLVIAVAGGVPNLPTAVMSWVRGIPVISVPIEERIDVAAAALTTPAEAPLILTGYGQRGLRKAGELAVQLLTWRSETGTVAEG